MLHILLETCSNVEFECVCGHFRGIEIENDMRKNGLVTGAQFRSVGRTLVACHLETTENESSSQ
jgi:hypothetical protein